jgi:hypothetical protein
VATPEELRELCALSALAGFPVVENAINYVVMDEAIAFPTARKILSGNQKQRTAISRAFYFFGFLLLAILLSDLKHGKIDASKEVSDKSLSNCRPAASSSLFLGLMPKLKQRVFSSASNENWLSVRLKLERTRFSFFETFLVVLTTAACFSSSAAAEALAGAVRRRTGAAVLLAAGRFTATGGLFFGRAIFFPQ